MVKHARKIHGPAVVLTFDPHPVRLLRPDQAPERLCWTDRKVQLLGDLGVDAMVAFPTDLTFLGLDAHEFFARIVIAGFDARVLVEGPNFFFGHGRSGNVGILNRFCGDAGIVLEVVDPATTGGTTVGETTISSSLIRSLIAEGKIDEANALLTQPYRIRGTVVRGAGRGAKIGFPTANLGQIDTLLPGEGIYAAVAQTGGRLWSAAVNIGPNPTFDEAALKVEAHLIGCDDDLYDRPIELDFLSRLREIKRFDSVEQLVAEMTQDVETTQTIARAHIAALRPPAESDDEP